MEEPQVEDSDVKIATVPAKESVFVGWWHVSQQAYSISAYTLCELSPIGHDPPRSFEWKRTLKKWMETGILLWGGSRKEGCALYRG